MKIEVTVNLGNYQNMKVISSEFDTPRGCVGEIRSYLFSVREPQTENFIKKYLTE